MFVDIDIHNEKMNNLAVQMHLANQDESKWLKDENSELLKILAAIILSNNGKITFDQIAYDSLGYKKPSISRYDDHRNRTVELILNDKI